MAKAPKKRPWPAAKVEMVRTADLSAYARNPRKHTPAQIRQVMASIQEFGWTIPILRDETGMVIAGHARLEAAKALTLDEVPCMTAVGWTEAQKKAYVIADNKLTENSSFDEDILVMEMGELAEDGFDLDLTGFSELEIRGLLSDIKDRGKTDPDDVPAEQAVAISQPGDVWRCGRHRVVCGDCTNATVVQRLLNGVKPHLMVTDPPYGVDYDPEWRNRAARHSEGMGNRAIGAGAIGRVVNDDRADWRDAWSLFPGDVIYVWHGGLHAKTVIDSIESCGFDIRAQIIWAKSNIAIGRGHYHWQHEPCWYAVRSGKTGHWSGDRKQSTLWQIDKPNKSETGHSAQKPVECMLRPIVNNSNEGQAVYEPFLGSGTTMIAAQMTGRACFGAEISPNYVDVAVRRWQNFTGEAATLEGDGRTFEEIEGQRTGGSSEEAGELAPLSVA